MLKKSEKNIRLGILGGTFDPPHVGHLHISKITMQKLRLNKFIWVVTKKNPLKKKPHLKFKKRIKLSKKMVLGERKISVHHLNENRCFTLKTIINPIIYLYQLDP